MAFGRLDGLSATLLSVPRIYSHKYYLFANWLQTMASYTESFSLVVSPCRSASHEDVCKEPHREDIQFTLFISNAFAQELSRICAKNDVLLTLTIH